MSAIVLAAVITAEKLTEISYILRSGDFLPVTLLLFLIPYLIIGYDVLLRAARNIAHGQIFDENFLMGIATVGAFFTGEYSEAVFVMLFYQVGELFQSIAVGKSRRSISSLLSLQADEANVIRDGEAITVDSDSVDIDEIIFIRPGEKIPLDAVVIEGTSSLNTAALTGESLPRFVSVGDEIQSGCVNCEGLIKARVIKRLEESTVSRILALVEDSVENKSKSENFITKFAHFYTPAVVIAALCLAIMPPIIIDIGSASLWKECIYRAMTFLVISCPCALVISVPLSYFSGIGSASSRGILVKGSAYLDTLAKCDTIVFDKTGTLTEGRFKVNEIVAADEIDEKYLLNVAALAESFSNHPISLSIKEAAGGPSSDAISDTEEIFGHGIRATVGGKTVLVGNARLMEKFSVLCPEVNFHGTVVHVAEEDKYLGHILISDREKSGARESLKKLRASGIKTFVMLTGDREASGKHIGNALGIDVVHTELLPNGKVAIMTDLLGKKKKGKTIAYVGDGINDAPVLALSDVGISMGALGSDAAIEASDIVLMDDNLDNIADAILLARRTKRIVIENIVFALGVKALVLILGALGLVGLNAAVFADVGVAVIAILNSMRNLKK